VRAEVTAQLSQFESNGRLVFSVERPSLRVEHALMPHKRVHGGGPGLRIG
jgi:hypothetical protein